MNFFGIIFSVENCTLLLKKNKYNNFDNSYVYMNMYEDRKMHRNQNIAIINFS